MEKQIAHFRIVSELGRGGMGVVYKAHEQSLNRFVAIKVLGSHLEEDPAYVERFVREAQSAAKLNHPNIVQIYSIGEENGQHYFVMEFVQGTSVLRILRGEGKMSMARASRIVLQTAAGLGEAHEQGIIHRDIKPANLMITERGLVKIADFGLALALGGASRLTATGMFMGTPGYLSPEQCLDGDVDHRTDIYSLGVSFYEMLTGVVPFKADSPIALLRQIVEVEPPDVRELNPEVDDDARELLARMMAKEPAQRFADCEQLITAVQAYLDDRGLSGSEAAAVSAGTSPPVVSPVAPPGLETDGRVTLNTSPTMAVDSDELGSGKPTPPPVPPSVSTQPAPAPEAVAPAPPTPRRGSRSMIIAMLIVLLGLAALATGAAVAWKKGVLQQAWAGLTGGESEPVDVAEGGDPLADADEQATGPAAGGSAATTGEIDTTESADHTVAVVAEVLPTTDHTAAATAGTTTEHSTATATGTSPDPAPPELAREATQQSGAATMSPPAKRADPPPQVHGTAVVAVGEQLLAGEAEAFLEKALGRLGIDLVDEKRLPEVLDLMASQEQRPGAFLHALENRARYVVVARAEYLGDRPLDYLGRRDTVFQSRLQVVPYDLASGEALGDGLKIRMEYNHLTVERKVEEALRRPARRLANALAERD